VIDVFAFAITIYEMITESFVLKNPRDSEKYYAEIIRGWRPDLKNQKVLEFESCYPISNLISQCWDKNSSIRPRMSEVTAFLK
jgi:hypothetical protein